jgi:hypothetical protein
MEGMLVAETTILTKLHSIRMFPFVLIGVVIPPLAFVASKDNSFSWHDLIQLSGYNFLFFNFSDDAGADSAATLANRET